MTFRTVPLGYTPSSGDSSPAQARKFKELLRNTVPAVEGVSLLTVSHVETQNRSVTAAFDDVNPMAAAWVKEAQDVSCHVWELVAKMGQRELVR